MVSMKNIKASLHSAGFCEYTSNCVLIYFDAEREINLGIEKIYH